MELSDDLETYLNTQLTFEKIQSWFHGEDMFVMLESVDIQTGMRRMHTFRKGSREDYNQFCDWCREQKRLAKEKQVG